MEESKEDPNPTKSQWGSKPIAKKISGSTSAPSEGQTTQTVTSKPLFAAWPKTLPDDDVEYQWKCAKPTDKIATKKLVQAAFATAINHKPHCRKILIRQGIHKGTDFVDGVATAPDKWHITISYTDVEGVFWTSHGYTNSERYLQITAYDSKKVYVDMNQEKDNRKFWPVEADQEKFERHKGKPYPEVKLIESP